MRARRKDDNHASIVRDLRKAGRLVSDVSALGGIGFDLLVGSGPIGFCTLEVKNPKRPPSARKLTDSEQQFLEQCQALCLPHYVVTSSEEALAATGPVRERA